MIPPPGELLQNITLCLILVHWPNGIKHNVIHKTGSTQHIATQSEEHRTKATNNMHKKLVKFGRVVFKLCERTDTNRQTNRQTYALRAPLRGEVTNSTLQASTHAFKYSDIPINFRKGR